MYFNWDRKYTIEIKDPLLLSVWVFKTVNIVTSLRNINQYRYNCVYFCRSNKIEHLSARIISVSSKDSIRESPRSRLCRSGGNNILKGCDRK